MSKIGYIRVSTEHQETARQQEIMCDYQVDRIFSEKLSGANTDRPQLSNVIKLRKSKIVTGKQRSCDYFYEYNVNFCKKILTKSRKCAAKPIRYTHLIGGLYHAELL